MGEKGSEEAIRLSVEYFRDRMKGRKNIQSMTGKAYIYGSDSTVIFDEEGYIVIDRNKSDPDTMGDKNTGIKLGEYIRDARLNKGMTVCDLAEKCGIGKDELIRIETGEYARPSMEILMKLACELAISFPYLQQLVD